MGSKRDKILKCLLVNSTFQSNKNEGKDTFIAKS